MPKPSRRPEIKAGMALGRRMANVPRKTADPYHSPGLKQDRADLAHFAGGVDVNGEKGSQGHQEDRGLQPDSEPDQSQGEPADPGNRP
jgi:hypothetical protein